MIPPLTGDKELKYVQSEKSNRIHSLAEGEVGGNGKIVGRINGVAESSTEAVPYRPSKGKCLAALLRNRETGNKRE